MEVIVPLKRKCTDSMKILFIQQEIAIDQTDMQSTGMY